MQQAIAAHKTELLKLLDPRSATRSPDVIRIARISTLPLSFFQERLWVLHRLEPENTAYNMVVVWAMGQSGDATRLADAIRNVVQRQEILRSTYRGIGGPPHVHILPTDAVPIDIHFLDDLDEVQQSKVIDEAVEAARYRPFDLATETPVRFTVYQNAAGQTGVLVAAHHIALDGWSLALLRREILAATTPSSTKPDLGRSLTPALQYVDFAAWQRAIQDPRQIASELEWWERQLAGIPQLCVFPPDKLPASRQTGLAHSFSWNADFSEAIRSLARLEGATVYMALLAACSAVLKVHTGQHDIVLGSPMGVRERPEFETMIGPFVNLLVLRLDLADDPTFAQLLRIARDAVLDAHAHREVPFELLIERLKPARTFNHPPLFQVAVVLHNAAVETSEPIHSGGSVHDLTWFLREVEGRFESSLEFRSDLYTKETIERIAGHLEAVLRVAVADRHLRISEISLLTAKERQQVLVQFNATAADVNQESVTAQFERQVMTSAHACAVSFDGSNLSYGALNRRANRLARRLQSLGIGRGSLVGLCLERSLDLIAALLAVQKAGAAYLPLDPSLPAERLEFMLTDSGASLLVTAGETAAGLVVPDHVHLLDLNAEAAALEELDASNLPVAASPEDLAYVIYTSGSLGQPKGVEISCGALSSFLGSMRREPGLSSTDILAAVTTVSFDIAGLELYLPLTAGARIELIPREKAIDGAALGAHLTVCGATILQATPVTWRQLVEADWRGGTGFRALCGGEALPGDLACALLQRVEELWNLYGPTETTIWSTIERVEPASGPVSIGRPIANTQVYILGSDGEPVPIGVPGEIWIGGAGVAIGYHNRSELTAERFVPDRFSGQPGARLYRTGDLGRWGADGRIFHLGRMDHQVKIRGVRIELGEIEAVLHRHPAVRQAVVVAYEAGGGAENLRLVAYNLYQAGEDLTATEVRRYLRRQLPEAMVPSVIVALDGIPLTQTGKVDRKALPDPFKNAGRAALNREPPAPGVEAQIAQIWQRLLKAEHVGAEDNFFDIGGHSLLALSVAVAVEKETGRRMDPRALFFQNLRQIAASLECDGSASRAKKP
jgi:amino acid adenylation domain-containing protein